MDTFLKGKRAAAARTKLTKQATKLQGTQKNEKGLGKMSIPAPRLRNTTYIFPVGSRRTGKPE